MGSLFDYAGAKRNSRRNSALLVTSIFGAASALAIDRIAARGDAALSQVAGFLTGFFGQPETIALLVAGVALTLLGAVGYAYFKPLSLKGAFSGGFIMVAVLAIFIA